jgi:ubiquinone/menaquinone biosynthesis C-methylase UbiE
VRLGADRVRAIDPDGDAVLRCRERLPGVDVRVGAAEALPYDDAEFDIVLGQLVVPLLADARQGGSEMRRVARPGGRVATCVWDFADGMTVLRTFWDAAIATGAPAPSSTFRRRAGHAPTRLTWQTFGEPPARAKSSRAP